MDSLSKKKHVDADAEINPNIQLFGQYRSQLDGREEEGTVLGDIEAVCVSAFVEFEKISFEPSKLGKLDFHFKLSEKKLNKYL